MRKKQPGSNATVFVVGSRSGAAEAGDRSFWSELDTADADGPLATNVLERHRNPALHQRHVRNTEGMRDDPRGVSLGDAIRQGGARVDPQEPRSSPPRTPRGRSGCTAPVRRSWPWGSARHVLRGLRARGVASRHPGREGHRRHHRAGRPAAIDLDVRPGRGAALTAFGRRCRRTTHRSGGQRVGRHRSACSPQRVRVVRGWHAAGRHTANGVVGRIRECCRRRYRGSTPSSRTETANRSTPASPA